ncbi:MAG: hypothetical protein HYY58_01075 [Candidatus Omnitrophica bacterium]|nr:hypothetical protein [Candidatus Omnitrophota bacterium]MBI3011072.1 hypothetical protein [Candidatus Omnitrophota bacterium]
MRGTTTTAYQQGAIRQGGVTTQMASCRRNPKGRAELRRIAASFVVAVLLRPQYGFLLTPCAAGS